jgi:hypothetical protein
MIWISALYRDEFICEIHGGVHVAVGRARRGVPGASLTGAVMVVMIEWLRFDRASSRSDRRQQHPGILTYTTGLFG